MKTKLTLFLVLALMPLFSCYQQLFITDDNNATTVADHSVIRRLYDQQIPEDDIQRAVETLHIGYGHTSHGSQITDGMDGLVSFANSNFSAYSKDLFQWSHDGSVGLHLFEGSGYDSGYLDHDCGYSGWDDKTKTYLDDYPDCNVIMWSWCGQVDDVNINSHYLNRMAALEAEYPQVTFIYMTGHLEGGTDNPVANNVLANNNAIRDYCRANGKWLFDFADIEKYDLDGTYYGDKLVNDGCNYDSDGNGSRDANWAQEWQSAHRAGTDWYNCGSQHSQPVNANQKAYAVWWLFSRIACERTK